MNINYQLIITSLVVPLVLGACGGGFDENTNITEIQEDKSITLSPSGVGPLNATSSFNMHQMTLAFSDFNVIEEVNYHLGAPYPVIRVSEGAKTLMIINPDTAHKGIFSIIIEDNLIKNSLGHRIGSLYSDVYSDQNIKGECKIGSADYSGKMICYAPKYANILYVFSGKGISDKTPSYKVLQAWGLESIIWRPKP